MIVPNTIKLRYDRISPHLDKAKGIIDGILFNYCQKNNFAYSSRIKTLNSLNEKLESARIKQWDEIDDLVASTLIIPNYSSEKEVLAFLKSQFNIKLIRNKKSFELDPEVFRYDATRVYCNIKSAQPDIQSELNKLTVEVQVRTALEHAWSVATHPLTYKSDIIDWKMSRLVSQFKADIEQLDMLIVGANDIKKHVIERGWTAVEFKKKIITETKNLFDTGVIPIEHKPKDFSRFSENILNVFSKIKDLRGRYKKNNFKDLLEDYLETLRALKNKFPMSITLYQIILGDFIERGKLDDSSKIRFFITTDLESLYPKSKLLKNRILLD